MPISRRQTLALIGGGTIAAATAAATTFATTRTPSKALAPWEAAGHYSDPRKQALSFAILAPNPHNRQPWQVDLRQQDTVILFRDKHRDLPHTDPHSRQLTIGLGCFLEQMTIAASMTGHKVDLDLYPQGEDGPVAIATFTTAADLDPLSTHMMMRRSCKEPFDLKPVGADHAKALSGLASVTTTEAEVAKIKGITWEAWMIEAMHPPTLKESVDLMRMGKTEINANPDGIDLGGAFLESLMLLGVLSREAQLDPNSTGFQEGIRIYREMLMATPAYATITTSGNTRENQIEAGRRWLRLNLTTTALGLSLHPVSQALQEFPEMAGPYQKIHKLLAKPGETVQMLGRLGYGPQVNRTPRWPLETRILNG